MRPLIGTLFAAAMATALLGFGITREAPKGRIEGQVVLSENGKALPHARVSLTPSNVPKEYLDEEDLEKASVKTDAEGRFRFSSLPAGQYVLNVSGKSHHANETVLTVGEGPTTVSKIKMYPETPYFNAYFSQQTWLPGETPKLELSGFITQESLRYEIFKINDTDLIQAGSANNLLQTWVGGNSPELKARKPVKNVSYKPQNRDVEGSFVDKMALDPMPEGLYFIRFTAGSLAVRGFLNISKVGMIVRDDGGKAVLFLTDLVSGKPISGAKVVSVTKGSKSPAGQTSDDGLLSVVKKPSDEASYLAYAGDSMAICSTFAGDRGKPGKIAFITDRPVYRPGDKVQFKGILRALQGSEYVTPAATDAKVTIKDPNGNLLETKSLAVSGGAFNGDWQGSKELAPGFYSFGISSGGLNQTAEVELAAYRKPEFSVEVSPVKGPYFMGEEAAVKVKATYFYGAPVVGAKFQANVLRSAMWRTGGSDEDGTLDDEGAPAGDFVQELTGTTDERGEAELHFKLDQRKPDAKGEIPDGDYNYSVAAYVSDATNKGVSGSGTFTALQGEFGLTLTPKHWFSTVGEAVEVQINARSVGGGKAASVEGKTISIESSRERYRMGEIQQEPYQTLSAMTDKQGQAILTVNLPKRGEYRLLAKTTDSAGRPITARCYIYASAPGEGEAEDRPAVKELSVTLDKDKYQVGDNLKALIQGGKPGSSVLISIDGEGLLENRVVKVDGSAATCVFPVTQAMAPNATLQVFAVSDKEFHTTTKPIKLDWNQKKLNIELSTDMPNYKPGQLATVRIKTSDAKGNPTPANLSLGVVDESIYAIKKDRFDIAGLFYPKRYSRVNTSYSFAEVYLDGGDKSPSKLTVRRKFLDTAYWNPDVSTDAHGEASIAVQLPDNLTQWRVTTVGITQGTDVGQSTASFRVRKPLMVRLDVPQFMVSGDRQQITASVTNDTGAPVDARIQLEATGIQVAGNLDMNAHLDTGQQSDFHWDVTAGSVPTGKVVASAAVGTEGDAVERTFDVLASGAPSYQHKAGALDSSQTFQLNLDASRQKGFGELKVQIAPSLSAGVVDALNGLVGYPYGCVEQTLDRFVPSLMVYQLAQRGAVPMTAELQDTPSIVKDGLARLATMQHADGSWGWWQYDPANGLMTALALEGIQKAGALGYRNPAIHEDTAIQWAEKEVSKEIGDTLKAYEALALGVQLADRGHKAGAKKALKRFDPQLAGPAEWALAARLYKRLGDQAGLATAIQRLSDKAIVEADMAHWLGQGWTDADANTGMAMAALLEVSPQNPLLDKSIRYVMLNRTTGGWSSTFSTGLIVQALASRISASGPAASQGSVDVVVNGKTVQNVALGNGPEVSVRVPEGDLVEGPNTVELRKNGSGAAFFAATLRQFTGIGERSNGTGLAITRSYHIVRPGRLPTGELKLLPNTQADDSAQSGDVLECQITIKNSEPREFVLIEDPIPSNCVVTERDQPDDSGEWGFWYSGLVIKDDRVAVFARNLPAGEQKLVYHFRAQVPGKVSASPTQVYPLYNPASSAFAPAQGFEVRQ